jgi:hypothetical protein
MHRLFHSLVVCGAGLTLAHCGGKSTDDEGDTERGGSGSGASASGGSQPGGSGASAGSPSRGGSGGYDPGGVAGSLSATGGTGNIAGIGGSPPQPDGPTEQWACVFSEQWCGSYDPTIVPLLDCKRDTARPVSQDDCPPDTRFSCMNGYVNAEVVPFQCDCVAITPGTCGCPELDADCFRGSPPNECPDTSFCGCVYTCILK